MDLSLDDRAVTRSCPKFHFEIDVDVDVDVDTFDVDTFDVDTFDVDSFSVSMALLLYTGGDDTIPTVDVDHHLDSMRVTSCLFRLEECGRLVVMKSKLSCLASCRRRSESSDRWGKLRPPMNVFSAILKVANW